MKKFIRIFVLLLIIIVLILLTYKFLFSKPETKTPKISSEICSYKIENKKVYIGYDDGENWIEVPSGKINLYNSTNKSKLINNLYTITPEVTAICNEQNKIFYSSDKGKNWQDISYTGNGSPLYMQFLNANTGFLIEITDSALGARAITILKTTDAGRNWSDIGHGPTSSIRDGSMAKMLDENVGFFMVTSASLDTSTLYRTEDGMKTFTEVELPSGTFSDSNTDFKWNEIYDTPNLPTLDANTNTLTLLLGQGSDGDYNGGISSKYISYDLGKTWKFVEEVTKSAE